jgi:membrane protein YqaA with SNARE-associated domain
VKYPAYITVRVPGRPTLVSKLFKSGAKAVLRPEGAPGGQRPAAGGAVRGQRQARKPGPSGQTEVFTVRRSSPGASVASSPCPVTALGPSWLDPNQLVETFGLIGTLIVIFAECGLLIGSSCPATRCCSPSACWSHDNDQQPIVASCSSGIAAIAGNQVGYLIGRKAGPALFNRPTPALQAGVRRQDQRVLRQARSAAIVLARFVPIVRTFITVDRRRREDELPHLHDLLGHRRRALGLGRHPARLRAGRQRLRPRPHRADPHRDRARVLLPVGFEVFRHRGKADSKADTGADTSTGSGTD